MCVGVLCVAYKEEEGVLYELEEVRKVTRKFPKLGDQVLLGA